LPRTFIFRAAKLGNGKAAKATGGFILSLIIGMPSSSFSSSSSSSKDPSKIEDEDENDDENDDEDGAGRGRVEGCSHRFGKSGRCEDLKCGQSWSRMHVDFMP